MTNKTYIKNTALLFSAMAITKIVGAVFKIPLANVLGGTGMGYFSTAYGLYSPIFALTAAGVPTVMMRLTAKNLALGREQNAVRTKKTALLLFTLVGFAGMLLILLLSGFFATNIACSPQSSAALKAISPAVLFCCIGSVIRGYYEGQSNVMPTAAANVTEAVSRAIIGLALSYGVIGYAKNCYDNGTAFLGYNYNTYDEVYEAALPWAAAAAILAVTLSELAGLISLIIHDRRKGKRRISQDTVTVDRIKSISSSIVKELIPIAAFALVMNCFSFIDLLTVTRTLNASVELAPQFFQRAFPEVFARGISADELANFMYGSYTGIAMSLFMLIPSFAGMTEKTAIPEIATAWEKKDISALTTKTESLIKAAAVIGLPACLGAAAMAEPILSLLYSDRAAETAVCMNSFVVLCMGGFDMIITSAFTGVFQAIGKGHIPLLIMIAVIGAKAVLNPMLLSIPEINITGAALSTVLCYLIASVLCIIAAKKFIPKTKIIRSLIKPLLCSLVCAVTAKAVYSALKSIEQPLIVTLIPILAGGIIYILLLIFTSSFRTSPIIKRQKQKKITKGLAKFQKIG